MLQLAPQLLVLLQFLLVPFEHHQPLSQPVTGLCVLLCIKPKLSELGNIANLRLELSNLFVFLFHNSVVLSDLLL